jgi:arsenite methyltransferase
VAELTDITDIRETVREKYAADARAAARRVCEARALESKSGCCGSGSVSCSPADETGVFGAALYGEAAREETPEAAVSASLGCGVPTAVADVHEGE